MKNDNENPYENVFYYEYLGGNAHADEYLGKGQHVEMDEVDETTLALPVTSSRPERGTISFEKKYFKKHPEIPTFREHFSEPDSLLHHAEFSQSQLKSERDRRNKEILYDEDSIKQDIVIDEVEKREVDIVSATEEEFIKNISDETKKKYPDLNLHHTYVIAKFIAVEKKKHADELKNMSKPSKYYIFEGFDHFKQIPLYQVNSGKDNENEYVGEWHTDRKDAEKELEGLTKVKPSSDLMVSGGGTPDDVSFFDTLFTLSHLVNENKLTEAQKDFILDQFKDNRIKISDLSKVQGVTSEIVDAIIEVVKTGKYPVAELMATGGDVNSLIGKALWVNGSHDQYRPIIGINTISNDNIKVKTKLGGSNTADKEESYSLKELNDLMKGKRIRDGKIELITPSNLMASGGEVGKDVVYSKDWHGWFKLNKGSLQHKTDYAGRGGRDLAFYDDIEWENVNKKNAPLMSDDDIKRIKEHLKGMQDRLEAKENELKKYTPMPVYSGGKDDMGNPTDPTQMDKWVAENYEKVPVKDVFKGFQMVTDNMKAKHLRGLYYEHNKLGAYAFDIDWSKMAAGGGAGSGGKLEYKSINTRSEKGLKEAERLKNNGWIIGDVGFETIHFWKRKQTPTMTKKMVDGGSPEGKAEVDRLEQALKDKGVKFTYWDENGIGINSEYKDGAIEEYNYATNEGWEKLPDDIAKLIDEYNMAVDDYYTPSKPTYRNDVTTIIISEKAPLDVAVRVVTGKGWNAIDFEGGSNEFVENSTGRKFKSYTVKEANERGIKEGFMIPAQATVRDFYESAEKKGLHTTAHEYMKNNWLTADAVDSLIQAYATNTSPEEYQELLGRIYKKAQAGGDVYKAGSEVAPVYVDGGAIVSGFNLIYQEWDTPTMGVTGTIRTTPENYLVASVKEDNTLDFSSPDAMTKDIDKEEVKKLWRRNDIPIEKPKHEDNYEQSESFKESTEYLIDQELKPLIAKVRERAFVPEYRASVSDADVLGIIVSKFNRWDADLIKETCVSAFGDANYRDAADAVSKFVYGGSTKKDSINDVPLISQKAEGKYSFKKGGTIETETPILPYVVAEMVAEKAVFEKYKDQATNWKNLSQPEKDKLNADTASDTEKLGNYLVERAETHYEHNPTFKKQIKSAKGLATLYMFMYHWAGIEPDGKVLASFDKNIENWEKAKKHHATKKLSVK